MFYRILLWLLLAFFLSILTFGFRFGLVVVFSIQAFLAGVFMAIYAHRKQNVDANINYYLSGGVVAVIPISSKSQPNCQPNPIKKLRKYDRRLTGSTIIDESLQEVLLYAFRDYIYNWYHKLSGDDDFPYYIRDTVNDVIITLANRSKEVEWVHYATTRLVDDFATHLRLFRKAHTKLKAEKLKAGGDCMSLRILGIFFEMEANMEKNFCREFVCTSQSHQNTYLQDVIQLFLYLVLPPDEFQTKALRFFIREILVNCVLLPMLNLCSDPDYINQTIVWMCKESLPTPEAFLMVLKCTDNPEELQAVRENVGNEIAILRSMDTGGDYDAEIKQQLSSLLYVKKVVENRIRRMQEGNLDTDSIGEMNSEIDPKKLSEPSGRLFALPFDVILTNNIALHYFIEFMTSKNAQELVFFYHIVEGYKASAEQQLSSLHLSRLSGGDSEVPSGQQNIESLREAALHIHESYLSEKSSSKVISDETLSKKLFLRIQNEPPSEMWFDQVQNRVFETMQEDKYLGEFRKSQSYIKVLAELDLLKETGRSDEDDISIKLTVKNPSDDGLSVQLDNLSVSSLEQDEEDLQIDPIPTSDHFNPEEFSLKAEIYNTGIIHNSGSQYAVYAISVVIQRLSNGACEKWCIVRRYSDFHSFHLSLMEKFPTLASRLTFPGKKAFYNLSRQFLEKRAHLLNVYLQTIQSQQVLTSNKGLQALVFRFLEPGTYDRQRRQFSKAMGLLVSPLKHSMKSVGTKVKMMPSDILVNLRDGLGKVLGHKIGSSLNPGLAGSEKVAAGLSIEGDDNIPLRIMLLLMDEVFDLKSKDQWFRRRIVVLLRQIIKATFGDTINRKIVDYVDWMTSAEQIAEYIKAFRESFWPNGCLASPTPERDHHTKMRTRVAAKTVLLASIPDELKHVIGSETTRKGMLCIFEMFQQPELNRRLILVLMEAILDTLFPENHLPDLFRKLHSNSSTPDGSSGSYESAQSTTNQANNCAIHDDKVKKNKFSVTGSILECGQKICSCENPT